MSRTGLRRAGAALTVTGLTLACGLSLPSTSARFNDSAAHEGATFSLLRPPPAVDDARAAAEGLRDVVAGAVCPSVPDAPVCEPLPDAGVPAWLRERGQTRDAAPARVEPAMSPEEEAPAPAAPAPRPEETTAPEDCGQATCEQEPVVVVTAFAERLEELRDEEPEDVPDTAVRTIAAFAEELRELPEPPGEDLELPEDTRAALGELAEAGLLAPFSPDCVVNVGQLADLITTTERQHTGQAPSPEPNHGPSPEPTPEPSGSCGAPEATASEEPTEPSSGTSSDPASEPRPQAEASPSASPTASEYPYDEPGHRVRRVD